MKKVVVLLTIFAMALGTSYASFPVKKDVNPKQNESETTLSETNDSEPLSEQVSTKVTKANPEKAPAPNDDFIILLVLWLLLGGFAGHRWYAKKPWGWNVLFILTAGGCGVWAIIDLIKIIQKDFM